MFDFFNLSSCELIALSAILSIYISDNFTADQTAILSAFFTMLGDNLAATAVTKIENDLS